MSKRPSPARRAAAKGGAAARARPAGTSALLGLVPPAIARRIRNWALGVALAGGIAAGIVAMGVPQMLWLATADAIGRMGFVVRNIEITGRRHVDRDAIYRVVMGNRGLAMPLVDLSATRAALLPATRGWIADARVSRRLPDTLVVDIVERTPAAIWQYRRQLQLIDGAGALIAPIDPRTVPDQLPLVIGPNANRHAAALIALIAGQPALKPLIEGATWIGGRRWDLRFQSGETIALPEGDAAARDALAFFARKDGEARLLGRGYVSFDLRNPRQLVVRTTREPGSKIEAPPPPPAPPAPTVATRPAGNVSA